MTQLVAQRLYETRDDLIDLNTPYFVNHLITYIGNKRRLLPFLNSAFCQIKSRLGKRKITTLDGFSGSGAVSRLLKYHSSKLISNDQEGYCETINKAYLANKDSVDLELLNSAINHLNNHKLDDTQSPYFVSHNYAPRDDLAIKEDERVFYTVKNARIIDNVRYLIDRDISEDLRVFCLANLLVKSSIHTNTSGVFKGFHKREGRGHFGGDGENALTRITNEISLDMPIFSEFSAEVEVTKKDLIQLVTEIEEVDLAYFDPPYNQHPYGSNYFMLNIINGGKPAEIQDGVSGIIKNWNKSAYNRAKAAEVAMDNLLRDTRAKFIAISYNNEGIIPIDIFKQILNKFGRWSLQEMDYQTYRGSRNLRNRNNMVKEFLWVLEKY